METASPELTAWVGAENAVAEPYLNAIPAREPLKKRLTELWNYEQYGYSWMDEKSRMPVKKGGRYFYVEKAGSQNQGVLYWAARARCAAQGPRRPEHALRRCDGVARRLLDQPGRPLRRLRGFRRRHGLGHLARARGRDRPRPSGPDRRHQVHRRVLASGCERVLLLALPEGSGRQGRRPEAGQCLPARARRGAGRRYARLRDPGEPAPQSLRHRDRGRALAGLHRLVRVRQQRRCTCATFRSPTPQSSACSTSGTVSTTSSAPWAASSTSAPPRARRAAA